MSLSALAGLVLVLALLVGLHFRVTGLPMALAALARKERAQDGGSLLDAMKEAVATRSGQAVIAVQTLQEQLAQSLRIQIAEAETRARMAERRAADTTTALEAASTVLRELRATLEAASEVSRELRTLQKETDKPSTRPPFGSSRPRELASPRPPPRWEASSATEDGDDAERKTWEMSSAPATFGYSPRPPAPAGYSPRPPPIVGGSPRPPAPDPPASRVGPKTGAPPAPEGDDGGFDDEDEMTRVADRGRDLTAFRAARRAPTLLPPAPALARVAIPPSGWATPPGPRTSGGEGAR
jgi:hypothetical protein